MDQGAWDDSHTRCMGVLLDGRAQVSGIRRRGADATVLVVVNSYHEGIGFELPTVTGGLAWRCVIDTNVSDDPDDVHHQFGSEYIVTGRSMLMLELVLDREYAHARGLASPGAPSTSQDRLRELEDAAAASVGKGS